MQLETDPAYSYYSPAVQSLYNRIDKCACNKEVLKVCLNEIQARELRGEDSLASVLEVKILEAIVENYQEKTNKPVLCIGEICSMLLFVENSYLLERTIKQAIESEQLEIEDCRLLTNQLKEAQYYKSTLRIVDYMILRVSKDETARYLLGYKKYLLKQMHSKEEKSEYKSRSFGVTMETLERKISKEYMLNNEFKTIIPSPVNSKLTNSNPRS